MTVAQRLLRIAPKRVPSTLLHQEEGVGIWALFHEVGIQCDAFSALCDVWIGEYTNSDNCAHIIVVCDLINYAKRVYVHLGIGLLSCTLNREYRPLFVGHQPEIAVMADSL